VRLGFWEMLMLHCSFSQLACVTGIVLWCSFAPFSLYIFRDCTIGNRRSLALYSWCFAHTNTWRWL